MSSIALPAQNEQSSFIRPLNVLRDLSAVADLVELCFASTMDSEGRSYLRQMRNAGHDNSFLRWADQMAESTSLPLSGLVWEQNNKIIGNTSLVPFRYQGKKIYLIANVATHPDHRRLGIARELTQRALQMARQKKADSIWLHVRADNPGAIQLYSDLGFVEQMRRTTYHAKPDPLLSTPQTDLAIKKPTLRDWQDQHAWLERLHPQEFAWYRNWNWKAFEPGILAWLYRLFTDVEVEQWSVFKGNELQAVLTWMPANRSDALWLATNPQAAASAIELLLVNARKTLTRRHSFTIEHPENDVSDQIIAAGFTPQRTLIWMQAKGATS